MTLHRVKREVVFSCDRCPETLETEQEDFAAAREVLEEKEWGTEQVGGKFRHYCPDCRSKRRRE